MVFSGSMVVVRFLVGGSWMSVIFLGVVGIRFLLMSLVIECRWNCFNFLKYCWEKLEGRLLFLIWIRYLNSSGVRLMVLIVFLLLVSVRCGFLFRLLLLKLMFSCFWGVLFNFIGVLVLSIWFCLFCVLFVGFVS